MSKEASNEVSLRGEQAKPKLQGLALESVVKGFWEHRIRALPLDDKQTPRVIKLFHHLDDVHIDYSTPRSDREISFLFGSIFRSLQLARLMTRRPPIRDFQYDNDKLFPSIITETLEDESMRKIFYDNLWRPPTTFYPLRGAPLQYVLRHEFGYEPITGVDYGAGLGTLPLLNSPLYINVGFPDKEKVAAFSKSVNLSLGISLDKTNRQESYLWTKTSRVGDDTYDSREWHARQVMAADSRQFPFIDADISDQSDSTKKIKRTALSHGQLPYLNFATSLFSGYQLDNPSDLENIVLSSLRNKGIWVNIGDELVHNADNLESYGVNVYRKEDRELVKLGTPFRIKDSGEIISTDVDYFRRPSGYLFR